MAQADNLNNTSSLWWSLAQTLVWTIRRIEMLPRDAEQIANSPEMNLRNRAGLERAEKRVLAGCSGDDRGHAYRQISYSMRPPLRRPTHPNSTAVGGGTRRNVRGNAPASKRH